MEQGAQGQGGSAHPDGGHRNRGGEIFQHSKIANGQDAGTDQENNDHGQSVDQGNFLKAVGKALEEGANAGAIIFGIHQSANTAKQACLRCTDGEQGDTANKKNQVQNKQVSQNHKNLHNF